MGRFVGLPCMGTVKEVRSDREWKWNVIESQQRPGPNPHGALELGPFSVVPYSQRDWTFPGYGLLAEEARSPGRKARIWCEPSSEVPGAIPTGWLGRQPSASHAPCSWQMKCQSGGAELASALTTATANSYQDLGLMSRWPSPLLSGKCQEIKSINHIIRIDAFSYFITNKYVGVRRDKK